MRGCRIRSQPFVAGAQPRFAVAANSMCDPGHPRANQHCGREPWRAPTICRPSRAATTTI